MVCCGGCRELEGGRQLQPVRQGAEERQPAQAHGGPALRQRAGFQLPVLPQAIPNGQLALEPLVAVSSRARAGR